MAIAVLTGLSWAGGSRAQTAPVAGATEQGLLCRSAIQQADTGSGAPANMLMGIGRVEAGRPDPVTGTVHPWPWTINAEGQGHFFDTKAQAITFARQLQQRGVRSMDVGCMQVNLMHHPNAFRDLEEAFDPPANARYAARFLKELRDKTGSWETAAAWYHSADPKEGEPYRARVLAVMAQEAKTPNLYAALPQAAPTPWPVAAGAARGMLGGRGFVTMLPHPAGGAVLAQPVLAGATPAAFSQPGVAGHGLDFYRMQPVRVVRSPTIAMR